jgi:hypothetical protein
MANYITKIRTSDGDLAIDYNALANKPNETLLETESKNLIEAINEINQKIKNTTSARIGEVILTANGWVGNESPYSQVVSIDGVTKNSQVDLTPSIAQLAVFYKKDLAFVTENENGVVTVYAIGEKPQNDYTIQVTITEVYYG